MSAKRRRFDTRTVLIVLLVITIVAAAYIVITNLPEEETFLTPEEIKRNRENFIDNSVVVKGFYTYEAGQPVVASDLSYDTSGLILNLGYLDQNETDKLSPDQVFKFSGVIEYRTPDQPVISDIWLVVEKIERV